MLALAAAGAVEVAAGFAKWLNQVPPVFATGFAAADGALRRHLAGRFGTVDADALPHAADVAALAARAFARGEAIAPERLEPAYLRDNVAMTLREQQAFRDAR